MTHLILQNKQEEHVLRRAFLGKGDGCGMRSEIFCALIWLDHRNLYRFSARQFRIRGYLYWILLLSTNFNYHWQSAGSSVLVIQVSTFSQRAARVYPRCWLQDILRSPRRWFRERTKFYVDVRALRLQPLQEWYWYVRRTRKAIMLDGTFQNVSPLYRPIIDGIVMSLALVPTTWYKRDVWQLIVDPFWAVPGQFDFDWEHRCQ